MTNLRLRKQFGSVFACSLLYAIYRLSQLNYKQKWCKHTPCTNTSKSNSPLSATQLKSCLITHPFFFPDGTFGTISLKTDSRPASQTGYILLLFIGLWNQPLHPQQARAGLPRPHSPRVRRRQPAIPGDDRGNEALEEFHVCTVTLSLQAPVQAHSDGPATHHHVWGIRPSVTGQTTAERLLHPRKTTACSPQVPLCSVS